MKLSWNFVIVTVVYSWTTFKAEGYSPTGERTIRSNIIMSYSYDRIARPNDSMTAFVGYNLLYINDLNIDSQTMACSGWLTITWQDRRLKWIPSSYDDTSYIHALQTEIWKPEIIVINAPDNFGLLSDDRLPYRIKYTGDVKWEPPLSQTVGCTIDVTFYPFVTQATCTIELTSWTLLTTELKLRPLWNTINLNAYSEYDSWVIQETNVSESVIMENNVTDIEQFSKLTFTITMRKTRGNYVISTFLPIIISSFLLTFTTLIPTASGERLTCGFLMLLLNALIMVIFMLEIPENTNTTLGIYLPGSFGLDCAMMLVTIIITRIHYRPNDRNVGFILSKVIFILKKLTWYTDPKPKVKPEPVTESMISIPTDDLRKTERKHCTKRNSVNPESQESFTVHVKVKESILPELNTGMDIDLRNVKLMQSKMCKTDSEACIEETVSTEKREKENYMTWDVVVLVIDRVVFLLFLGVKIAYNLIVMKHIIQQKTVQVP